MDFLFDFEKENDCKIAFGDISILDKMQEEYEEKSTVFSGFLKVYCDNWSDLTNIRNGGMKTIIVLSYPYHSISKVTLHYDNRTLNTTIPAGYYNYYQKNQQFYDKLTDTLKANNIQYVDINIPLKNLAVRLGLAEYGRNNVTYVDGYGSYHYLIAVACDKRFTETYNPKLNEPHQMIECASCNLCINSCPMGAISENNYLIDMQKCISLYNQELNEWPNWILKEKVRFLIACGACQMCCPRNHGLIKQINTYEFSVEETMAIVNDVPKDNLIWNKITNKMSDIGLSGFEDYVYHNIKMLY